MSALSDFPTLPTLWSTSPFAARRAGTAMDLSPLASSFPVLPSSTPSDALAGLQEPHKSQAEVPGIPLELLERILRFTLLPRLPLTPFSDPFHLRNSSHLLVVSKAFKKLCEPLFYSHITFARHSDFRTFFDPEYGLFVVGEEGRRRWRYVRALRLVGDVHPEEVFPHGDQTSWIVPLVVPEPNPIETVCIHCSLTEMPVFEEYGDAALAAVDDEDLRSATLEKVQAQHRRSGSSLALEDWVRTERGASLEQWVSNLIVFDVRTAVRAASHAFWDLLTRQFLPHTAPLSIVLPDVHQAGLLSHLSHGPRSPLSSILVIHALWRSDGSAQQAIVERILSMGYADLLANQDIRLVHLHGYSFERRPFFLEQFYEGEAQPSTGPRRWRYAREVEGRGLVMLPLSDYARLIAQGDFEALTDSEERAWRGLPPLVSANNQSAAF